MYVLLRETGWRGTDVLNLRYDNCLQYIWNAKEKRSVPYLCGEITKVGIPQLKDPIRDEVAEMVKLLAEEAKNKSTQETIRTDTFSTAMKEEVWVSLSASQPFPELSKR